MLLVDKPAGPTSHDVVAAVRRAFQTRRAGHTGTLDPFATGLLVVLVGRATRLARFLVGMSKDYTGMIRLGVTTATDDLTGETIQASDTWETLDDEAIRRAMESLKGEISQRPPRFSAKQVEGRRAHRRARRGEEFELAPEAVTVHEFRMIARTGADLEVSVSVGSGAYIRALARDLGERLGCGAHLAALRRTRVGPFRVEDAAPLDQIVANDVPLRPPWEAVGHLQQVELSLTERSLVRQGRSIPLPARTGLAALLESGELVAVGEADGAVCRPVVVLDING